MTSFAWVPEPHEVPAGMRHVGWYCASPDHDCLMSLDRVEHGPREDGEVYLYDAQHHAHWVPVYVRIDEAD